jgi:hypothetical protein
MGGALAGYLPKEWNGKRVAVRFARGRGFDARLVGDNAGGITVEPIKEEDAQDQEERARSAFVPWSAVRYIQLLEEPSEGQRARPKSTAAKKPENPAP